MNKNFMDKVHFIMNIVLAIAAILIAYQLGRLCQNVEILREMVPLTQMMVDK